MLSAAITDRRSVKNIFGVSFGKSGTVTRAGCLPRQVRLPRQLWREETAIADKCLLASDPPPLGIFYGKY